MFPLYASELLYLSDDNSSHQSFPLIPIRCQVYREAQGIAEAFKGAIKVVVRHDCSNTRDIEVVKITP